MFRFQTLLTRSRLHGLAIAASLLATTASTLSVYPHQLSYFNEASGGPENGHKHLLHSNIDWGQDLIFLNEWIRQNALRRPVFLGYYGYLDPRDLGVDCHHILDNSTHTHVFLIPETQRLRRGIYAVSIGYLSGVGWRCPVELIPRLADLDVVGRPSPSLCVFSVTSRHGDTIDNDALIGFDRRTSLRHATANFPDTSIAR